MHNNNDKIYKKNLSAQFTYKLLTISNPKPKKKKILKTNQNFCKAHQFQTRIDSILDFFVVVCLLVFSDRFLI